MTGFHLFLGVIVSLLILHVIAPWNPFAAYVRP